MRKRSRERFQRELERGSERLREIEREFQRELERVSERLREIETEFQRD